MTHAAIAKVFTSRNSQVIRLPRAFRLDTNEVFISWSGDSLILTPRMKTWAGFIERFSGFSADFAVSGGISSDIPSQNLT